VVVDSNDPAGLELIGNSQIKAQSYYFTGSPGFSDGSNTALMDASGNTLTSSSNLINSSAPPTPDPLASLAPPSQPSTSYGDLKVTGGTQNLSPGYYQGISASGGGNIVLQPGIYYIGDKGFNFAGNGNLTVDLSGGPSPDTGNGVLIYQSGTGNQAAISINGNGTVTLPAPTTGTYQGITLWQQRDSTNTMSVTGNGSSQISGTFYAQQGTLAITGNGSASNTLDTLGGAYVSNMLSISGNGSFILDYLGSSQPPPPPNRTLQLVE
jgi:hypothetical protein